MKKLAKNFVWCALFGLSFSLLCIMIYAGDTPNHWTDALRNNFVATAIIMGVLPFAMLAISSVVGNH